MGLATDPEYDLTSQDVVLDHGSHVMFARRDLARQPRRRFNHARKARPTIVFLFSARPQKEAVEALRFLDFEQDR